ncbi:alpha/beta hydrolase fold domain-containing protein [Haliscomenobacter sp.]|uniref:alpha/beta hydrolase fold domain-containing protein n=1 Tax=Haliscomenobacter sp. TaxID=2717303 RepID=UPI003BAA2D1B
MMIRYQLLLFIFLGINSLLMAQARDINAEKTAIQSSRYWLDIDYVGDGHIGHRLDVHLPAKGKKPFPVIVCVYGSAWFSNNSKGTVFSTGLGQVLLNAGFAVVNVNHRSSTDGRFPAQIQDVRAAIRFIRGNSEKFGIDNNFVGITGWSSGGHLSAFTGTSSGIKDFEIEGSKIDLEGNLGKYTQESSAVDAVVDWFGPTDFLIMDECGSSFAHNEAKSPESSLVGGPIQENKVQCALANPMTYVSAKTPPFLIFHGDKDNLVPHCQSEKLYETLHKAGVQSELVIVPGGQHGPGVMEAGYYAKMVEFFRKELKKKK